MAQRVNIQYSIEIDKLEEEVQRLVDAALTALSDSSPTFVRPKNILSVATTHEIEKLRQQLGHIDQSLGDINKIVGGYLSYQASLVVPPSPPEQEQENPRTADALREQSEDILSSVQEAVQSFKDNNVTA